jgi:hypothetical protein
MNNPYVAPKLLTELDQLAQNTQDRHDRVAQMLAEELTREGLETHKMYEKCLPDIIAGNTPGMILYSGGIVALDYLAARELSKHHHRRLAHVLTAIDVGMTLPFAIHNEMLIQK